MSPFVIGSEELLVPKIEPLRSPWQRTWEKKRGWGVLHARRMPFLEGVLHAVSEAVIARVRWFLAPKAKIPVTSGRALPSRPRPEGQGTCGQYLCEPGAGRNSCA